MDAHAKKLVASVKAKKITKAAAATAYAKEWKRTMGRSLPAKSAEATITQAMAMGGGQSVPHAPSNMQRGGMSPVSWSTGAGSPTNTPSLPGELSAGGGSAYGAYPGYIMKGFDNIMWQSAAANCSKQDSFPMPIEGLGSNAVTPTGATPLGATTYTAKGGRRGKKTRKNRKMHGAGLGNLFAGLIPGMSETSGGNAPMAMAYRPFGGTNPTGLGADMQYQWKGMPPGASPSSVDPNWSYRTNNVAVPKFDELGAVDRTLAGKDISSVSGSGVGALPPGIGSTSGLPSSAIAAMQANAAAIGAQTLAATKTP
jgi:hypothetical protein